MTAIILVRLLVGHKVLCQGTFCRASFRLGAATTVAEVQARVLALLTDTAAITAFTSVNKNSLGHNLCI